MQNGVTVLAVVLIVLLVLILFGGAGMMGGMMGGYGFAFHPLGWIGMLAFWALIIGGGALLVIWLVRNSNKPAGGEAVLDILKTRYARGEITKEQFDALRKDLGV